MDTLTDGFQWIIDFFNNGSYNFAQEAMEEATAWVVVGKIKAQIWGVQFAWGVAQNVMMNVGISQQLESTWNSLDSVVLGYMNFFRLPDAINIIFQAYTTKIVLKTMGW